MSQIRSHIKYLIQTYNIVVLILYLKLIKNLASVAVLILCNIHLLFAKKRQQTQKQQKRKQSMCK